MTSRHAAPGRAWWIGLASAALALGNSEMAMAARVQAEPGSLSVSISAVPTPVEPDEIHEAFSQVGEVPAWSMVGIFEVFGKVEVVASDQYGGTNSPYLKIHPRSEVRVEFAGGGTTKARFWWGGGDVGNRVRVEVAQPGGGRAREVGLRLIGSRRAMALEVSEDGVKGELSLDNTMYRPHVSDEPFFEVSLDTGPEERITAITWSIHSGARGAFEVDDLRRPRGEVEWNAAKRRFEIVPPRAWTAVTVGVVDPSLVGMPIGRIAGLIRLEPSSPDGGGSQFASGTTVFVEDGLLCITPADGDAGRAVAVRFEVGATALPDAAMELWGLQPKSVFATESGP